MVTSLASLEFLNFVRSTASLYDVAEDGVKTMVLQEMDRITRALPDEDPAVVQSRALRNCRKWLREPRMPRIEAKDLPSPLGAACLFFRSLRRK